MDMPLLSHIFLIKMLEIGIFTFIVLVGLKTIYIYIPISQIWIFTWMFLDNVLVLQILLTETIFLIHVTKYVFHPEIWIITRREQKKMLNYELFDDWFNIVFNKFCFFLIIFNITYRHKIFGTKNKVSTMQKMAKHNMEPSKLSNKNQQKMSIHKQYQRTENIKKWIESKSDKGNKTHKDDWMGEIWSFIYEIRQWIVNC